MYLEHLRTILARKQYTIALIKVTLTWIFFERHQ